MKKIGLLASALIINAVVFAQSSERKNEHGVAVSTVAKSETQINKGENVSGTASSKSHASVTVAKPHTSDNTDKSMENKEAAAAANKAEAKAAVGAKKEALISRKEDAKQAKAEKKEAIAEHKDEMKAKADASVDASVKAAEGAGNAVNGTVKSTAGRARGAQAGASSKGAAKVQLRRPNVAGSVGAATRVHL